MKKVILQIDGMSCSGCSSKIEKYLNKQDGVNASVNLVTAQALINYDDSKLSVSDLEGYINECGYKSLGIYNDKLEEKPDNLKYYLIIFAFFLIILMYVSMSYMLKLPIIKYLKSSDYPVNYGIFLFLFTIPFIIFGIDLFKSGIKKIIHKNPNMDTLITIGVFASFIYSTINLILIILGNSKLVMSLYFESSAMIIYFVELGKFIDKKSKSKVKDAIKELVQITPRSALLKTSNSEKEISIDEVKKGDILVCKPGMKVAVDGVIIEGEAYFDESFMTGESLPSKKCKNDNIIAGSVNMNGYVQYKALKIGPESTISEIVKLVNEAINTKPPIGKLADIISGYFISFIIVISILTFIFYFLIGSGLNEAIISFISVLVVACPCSLGLATPLAIVTAEGSCAKKGILIKNSETLEKAHKIDTIVFDKTGTLTYGNMKISKLNNYSRYDEKELLSIIASIENKSSHPIANAFKEYFDKKVKVTNFENILGIGISGIVNQREIYIGNNKLFEKINISNNCLSEEKELANDGNSIIYVIEDKKVIALIGVKDIVRKNAKSVIMNLKEKNKRIVLLSGDNLKTAKIIAKELAIDDIVAKVTPKEKENTLKKIINEGHNVMMVGDGINDALSLVSSTVGVSINSGTDIAGNSADVILMQDDISKIIDLLEISKQTFKIIKQNLFWAFFYNILMISIAIGVLKPLGISITPGLASLAMVISSLSVVFNSLRLKNNK